MGTEQPQEGDQVSWKWGAGHPEGTVAETKSSGDLSIQTQAGHTVKKLADQDNPAVRISRSSGQDVVKRATELHVEKKANDTENQSAKTLKRKNQATTPKKDPKTPKKARTGKEADSIASDNDNDDDADFDQDEDGSGSGDPELTEEDASDDDNEEDEEDKLAEKPTKTTTNTDKDKDKKGSAAAGKANNTTKSGSGSSKTQDPEPKRGSINALLNETDSNHHEHPRHAKEVAERRIAETVNGGGVTGTANEGVSGDGVAEDGVEDGDGDAYQPGEDELVDALVDEEEEVEGGDGDGEVDGEGDGVAEA